MGTNARSNLTYVDHFSGVTAERLSTMLGLWSGGDGPLYRQLSDAIAAMIDSGVLRSDELLPPERGLAVALSVARGTVVKAYDALAEDGLVGRVQGSGTRITGVARAARQATSTAGAALFDSVPDAIDLLCAVPKVMPRVRDLVARIDPDAYAEFLDDHEPAGVLRLRQRIAEHVSASGLPTSASQIMVTAGAQQGTSLAAELYVTPGATVVCESVTWPGLTDSVRARGGKLHGIAMDHGGVVVDELRAAVERLRPVCISLNPHHHNPTGTRLDARRRLAVAEIAAAYGVPLIEDRVSANLAFDGQVPVPLAAHGGGEHLLIDSISKVAWPGLRLGWMRADAPTITRLRTLRATLDINSPWHSQVAAIHVLDDWATIAAERCAQLRGRADVLVDTLAEFIPEWQVPRPRGGLSCWIELPDGHSARALCAVAAKFGVLVAGSDPFAVGVSDDRHIRIPFTQSEPELIEGVARLAAAWRTTQHT